MAMASQGSHARPDRRGESSEAIEDYVKAIYALSRRGAGTVGTTALAERLGVMPATATAMLKRLERLELIRYEPYHGAALTPAGERVALEVVRHHRLLESYLSEVMGMSWDRVHGEAEVLEHYISEELEQLIAERLGEPSHDPHGDPIPGPDLQPPAEDATSPLSALAPGESATFSRVSDSEPEMLRFLAKRGIRPGVELTVTDCQPFGGPMTIEVEGSEHALGGELIARIRVS